MLEPLEMPPPSQHCSQYIRHLQGLPAVVQTLQHDAVHGASRDPSLSRAGHSFMSIAKRRKPSLRTLAWERLPQLTLSDDQAGLVADKIVEEAGLQIPLSADDKEHLSSRIKALLQREPSIFFDRNAFHRFTDEVNADAEEVLKHANFTRRTSQWCFVLYGVIELAGACIAAFSNVAPHFSVEIACVLFLYMMVAEHIRHALEANNAEAKTWLRRTTKRALRRAAVKRGRARAIAVSAGEMANKLTQTLVTATASRLREWRLLES